jgi:hypothetical protein
MTHVGDAYKYVVEYFISKVGEYTVGEVFLFVLPEVVALDEGADSRRRLSCAWWFPTIPVVRNLVALDYCPRPEPNILRQPWTGP